jgi:hypothetical protein
MKSGKTDEVFTPPYAIKPLLPYLKKELVIFECAYGSGNLAKSLSDAGYTVIGDSQINFLEFEKDDCEWCDYIVTNPPYSKKTAFLKKCFEIGKPFALLLPLTALEGKERNAMYRNYGIQLIIPDRRIHFLMTETRQGSKSSSWFQTAWFTHGLNLPQQLNFVVGDW